MDKDFAIQPLTPNMGAEISGLDITRLDDSEFDRLYRSWLEHKVIFLRDQSLDLDQLLAFSRRFGELMQLPYIKPYAEYAHVIRVLKQADETNMGVFGGDWHSDFSFLAAPPKTSILYAEQLPPVGGDTLWIDMSRALANLPQGLLEALQGRMAIHAGTPYGVSHAPAQETRSSGSIEIERNNPQADLEIRHPAICRHPETGETMLFVNPTYTIGIEGYSSQDSAALLSRVYQHCYRPEFSCRFKWTPGCVTLWDNRNTMHYAVNDYDGYRRCLYRTTIQGERPLPA